jgi:hypothetical protein
MGTGVVFPGPVVAPTQNPSALCVGGPMAGALYSDGSYMGTAGWANGKMGVGGSYSKQDSTTTTTSSTGAATTTTTEGPSTVAAGLALSVDAFSLGGTYVKNTYASAASAPTGATVSGTTASTTRFDAGASIHRDKGLALAVVVAGVADPATAQPTYGIGYNKLGEFQLEANLQPYSGFKDFSGMTLDVGVAFYFGMFALGGQYTRVTSPVVGTVATSSYAGLLGVKQKNLGIQVAYAASSVSGTQGLFTFSGFVEF